MPSPRLVEEIEMPSVLCFRSWRWRRSGGFPLVPVIVLALMVTPCQKLLSVLFWHCVMDLRLHPPLLAVRLLVTIMNAVWWQWSRWRAALQNLGVWRATLRLRLGVVESQDDAFEETTLGFSLWYKLVFVFWGEGVRLWWACIYKRHVSFCCL